jgi:hypothetical protein
MHPWGFQFRTCIALLSCLAMHAQIPGGSVSGTVKDASGASVPRATVVLVHTLTEIARTLTTNRDGFYTAPNLLAGEYVITASAKDFEKQMVHFRLNAGAQAEIDFELRVGSIEQSIELSAPRAGIDSVSATVGAVVNQRTVEELPLNGRSWTDLAALQPGVISILAQPLYTAGNSRGNRGFGNQLAISGQRPQQSNYRLDGISINDYSNGGPGSVIGGNLGVDAILEFSVFTAAYSAAYGKASGGVINATTRSGANGFHGSAYEFLRNSVLDARNFFDPGSPPPFRRNQFGATAGGPIVKNRTFIFGNYEAIRQSTGVTNISTVPSAAARNGNLSTGRISVDPSAGAYLAFYPLPKAGLLGTGDTGLFTFAGQQVADEDYFTIRADHIISDGDRLAGSYRFDHARFHAPDSLATEVVGSATRNQSAAVEENHIFSHAALNSLRFGVNRSVARNNESISPLIPASTDTSLGAALGRTAASVIVPGLTTFAGGFGGTGAYLYHFTTFQLYDDLSLTRGRHSLSVGFALERMRANIQAFGLPNGQFNFGSLAGFLTNQPTNSQLGSASSSTPRGLRETIAAGYVQDDWRVLPNFTVNLGARYEASTVPTEVNGKLTTLRKITDATPHLGDPYFSNPTLHNIEARTGLSWDPFRDGKTSVRSGFGVFDVLPLPYEFNILSILAAPFYIIGTIANPPAGSFPSGARPFLGATSLAQAYIEPDPRRNYVLQWIFNIQRSLGKDLTLEIGYTGSHGVHQPFRSDDVNLVLPQATPAGYMWPSPSGSGTKINPNNGQIRGLFWDSNSFYHALQTHLTRRFHGGLEAGASFTWSRSIDTSSSTLIGNAFSNAIAGLPWYDLSLARGVSDFNVPRVAIVHSLWQIPFASGTHGAVEMLLDGWQIGGILKASGGIPFTPLIAGDPLGEKSLALVDFPDRLASAGCESRVNQGNPSHYIRTQCFAFPSPATRIGNGGRNILQGPGLVNLDLSLMKNVSLPAVSRELRAQWRVEFFNALNRANFMPPLNNLSVFDASGRPVGSAGLLDTTATPSRQLQLAFRLIW